MGYFKICAAAFFFSVKLRFFAFIFGVRRAFCICRGTVRIFGIKRCAVLRCCGWFTLLFRADAGWEYGLLFRFPSALSASFPVPG